MTQVAHDAIVIGAGAAGLMCAIQAGRRGRRVAVLDHSRQIGRKILISGGGRCNFTNIYCRPENFISNNPHFAKSALARYTPSDFIELIERHQIPYHEKTRGQLFCDRSAQDVLSMLTAECRRANVQIFAGQKVTEITNNVGFIVRTDTGKFHTSALIVATGGLSIPKAGATSFGYDLARQFRLRIVEPRPALVPVLLEPEDRRRWCDLAGVATDVIASVNGQSFREKMLITHRGLSGPAILQISSYWKKNEPIEIDLLPGQNINLELRRAKRNLEGARAVLRGLLPNRLADRWVEVYPPGGWSNAALDDFERGLHHWRLVPEETAGFEKAEVTAGGIDTQELSAKTLEVSQVPGLFFIGEVVDVTGHLGGFNFQWAWASGFAAGQAV